MARESAKRAAAAAATDAASDDKKRKQTVFRFSVTVVAPKDLSPVPLELHVTNEAKRAARQAKDKATRVEQYGRQDFAKFATPFAAAIASASAKKGRPVKLGEVITEMTNMTDCEPKFRDKSPSRLKAKWCWDGFSRDLWQISRRVNKKGLVPFPKGLFMHSDPSLWYFSPSPAARCPLADLSK